MIWISHRGNINGPILERENHPDYILEAINRGFQVEVDVWFIENKWILGHDKPTYSVKKSFFSDKMWLHCKNLDAAKKLYSTNLNWFWHEFDKITLTSKGYIWSYPNVYIENGIVVELGEPTNIMPSVLGMCTDFPLMWKKYKKGE